MTISAVATRTLTLPGHTVNTAGFGVVQQNDGSYVVGFSETSNDFPYPSTSFWYRSTDQGATWTPTGNGNGSYGQANALACNVRKNIILSPGFNPPDNEALLQRSTNGGQTWTIVLSAAPAPPPNGRFPWVTGANSYARTKAVCWGALDGNAANPPYLWATSEDAGVTWTRHPAFDTGNYDDIANALGIAAGGNWYMQYTKFGGINRTSNFARTTNGGVNWTPLTAPPGGTGAPPNLASSIACFTTTRLAMGGLIGSNPSSSAPGLWWSDDAGATLHLLSPSDVASWPTGSFNTWVQDVKRLTRDSALIGIDQQNGTPGSPWRITIDQGHTYPIVVAPDINGWMTYQIPMGSAVATRDGAVLAALWQSDDYEAVTLSVYKIAITC